jgi:hypothetical protein
VSKKRMWSKAFSPSDFHRIVLAATRRLDAAKRAPATNSTPLNRSYRDCSILLVRSTTTAKTSQRTAEKPLLPLIFAFSR